MELDPVAWAEAHLPLDHDVLVHLGPLRVRVRHGHGPDALSYFTQTSPWSPGDAPPDATVLAVPAEAAGEAARLAWRWRDRTFRGDRFASGFYLTHHWGQPAALVTRGSTSLVVGGDFDRIMWPYFTKHLLTVLAMDRGWLHVKAAAFELDGGVTLLTGRGSGGKTVFLAQACQEGARFVSNTHVLLDGDTVHGVPSVMRVRRDPCFAPLVDAGGLAPHLESGEYRCDPRALFPQPAAATGTVTSVCVVDYRDAAPARVRRLDAGAAYDYLELFAFPVVTYGLKDDVLAWHGGVLEPFVAAVADAKRRLRDLVERHGVWHVQADMLDEPTRRDVLARVSAAAATAGSPS